MEAKSARYNAETIAKWFLAYNRLIMCDEDADYISNLKLQKLLYYAQGTYYAITNRLLFNEELVAWRHGPVVEEIYHKYKEYGSKGIDFQEQFDFNMMDEETQKILEEVYNTFGQYSAWKLRNMTHEEEPWKSTDINDPIDNEKIKEYFLREYIE